MKIVKGFVEISEDQYEAMQVTAKDCVTVVIYKCENYGLRFTYSEKFTELINYDLEIPNSKVHNIFNIDQYDNEGRN